MTNEKQDLLEQYEPFCREPLLGHLRQLAEPLKGLKVLHVNSTREGGGVAEILRKLIPLKRSLGIDARWEVIEGEPQFYETTKGFHNALQGMPTAIGDAKLKVYEETNERNAEKLAPLFRESDIVFIHDPQPAALIRRRPPNGARWIWRCHINMSRPYRPVWKYLRKYVEPYDASIFSLAKFSRRLPHTQYLIPPSIDPLNEKNIELPAEEVEAVWEEFGLDPERPMILQVSRFDRFKDPLGVIEAYRLARKHSNLQLVLAGGSAADDPEGQEVLKEVREAAEGDPDIHILDLPPDSHRKINALQRAADIVLQKSVKEGFGLTVTEAMWKEKPVIGGDTGGIALQVVDHHTGFLVLTPEGAALRIRYLLHRRDEIRRMGREARRHVQENFLIVHHLRHYLALMIGVIIGEDERIKVWRQKELNSRFSNSSGRG